MPVRSSATMSKVVATGRRMKGREGLIGDAAFPALPVRGERADKARRGKNRSWIRRGVLGLLLLPATGGLGGGSDGDLGAVAQPVGAVHHYALSGCEARLDRDSFALRRTGLHGADRDRVVRLHHIDVIAGRAMQDR